MAVGGAHPYFGMLKTVMPAETGRMGAPPETLAMAWPQVFSHVAPRSGLEA